MGVLTFAEMCDRVAADGVTTTEAGVLINQRYAEGVTDALFLEKEIDLGTTVADQSEYSMPETDLVQIEYAYIGTVPYDRIGIADMKALQAGRSFLGDTTRGAIAPAFDSSGTPKFELYPTPSDAGDTITGIVADAPTALTGSGTTICPAFFDQSLIDGARALVYDEEDERGSDRERLEASFNRGVVKLKTRKNIRIGRGPVQAKVKGVHF